jgi:alpha-methylacyl-CoA racemase
VDGLIQPTPAPRFSRTPGTIGSGAPAVGEHSRAVLADFGIEATAVARLIDQGVVTQS